MGRADHVVKFLIVFFVLCFFAGEAFILTSGVTDPLDAAALRALYISLNAAPQLEGWRGTGGDPCGGGQRWRGVSCSGNSVVAINIRGLGVDGSLGSQLSTLQSLKELDVSCNNITGEIPLGLPPNLTYIDLAANKFTKNIPPSWFSVKFLEHLNVSHNSLYGPIGSIFSDMQMLETLDLSFNQFTGDLPSSFTSLRNLRGLYLQENEFTGSVSFLANLPLSALNIENNRFSGYVPQQFESIPCLRIGGNLFQPGYSFPLHPINDSSHSSGSSADHNVSHSPTIAPSSFNRSSRSGSSADQIVSDSPIIAPSSFNHSSHSSGSSVDQNVSHNPTIAPSSFNHSSYSSSSSVDQNVSHSPTIAPISFDFSSVKEGLRKKKRLGRVMISVLCGAVLVAILVAAVFAVRIYKSLKSRVGRSKSPSNFRDGLPISALMRQTSIRDQCFESSRLTTMRSSSIHYASNQRISKRRSCSRISRDLSQPSVYNISDILTATNNFSEDSLVGEGAIGHVFKAEVINGQTLAVKKVHLVPLGVHEEEEFLDVVRNMSRLRHPNITNLLGYCVDCGEHILIYEYASGGSLDDVLFSANPMHNCLSWKVRIKIALGVAHALEYMHWTCSPPIAHGNLKSTNILLDEELLAHVTDCGLTAIMHLVDPVKTASEFPVVLDGYAAPEFGIPGVDKTKNDVYSFGVILLELLTGKRAFDSSRRKRDQYLVNWASSRLHDLISLRQITDPAIRGGIPSKSLTIYAAVILLCIQQEPEFRSTMTEIKEKLVHIDYDLSGTAELSSVEECFRPILQIKTC